MILRDVGEKRIVEMITSKFSILMDDCAAIDEGDEYLLITTDMVYEKTHFPAEATSYQKGWYAVAVNLSDIASEGGKPFALNVAIGMPRNYEIDMLDELLDGIYDCASLYNVDVVGGDTKETDFLTISITVLGRVSKERIMRRKGAKTGDALFVTGTVGKGAALKMNDMEKLMLVKPRVNEGIEISKYGVTSCMDLSDGLASSLHQLAEINNVGFRVYADLLPFDEIAISSGKEMEYALYHGGDFELLFTVPPEVGKQIRRAVDAKRIGEVVEKEKGIKLILNGEEMEIENRGYEHFVS